jgi:hypothetical protein
MAMSIDGVLDLVGHSEFGQYLAKFQQAQARVGYL